ncbi:FtsX-like permease family protein [Exiguobacterium oxidotolerans]|uniref:FtsX-like permease family protein n=1 Tax=Exiguobacterium oxidotolerans TaxID=223958 RepID=UPI000493EF4D|nr:ABC transporter permease [Exiguobacterium oxidotolerans]
MLKFIWNSWWRNKERFILLLVGVLIVSTGLSYLIGTTQANNGTIVDELQKRWNSSYDIVVRPEGSRSVTEELNLLEPNYMSGLDGGITRKQYETIKQIADVEVAAPIAMIGNVLTSTDYGTHTYDKEGIYKVTMTDSQNTGLKTEDFTGGFYQAVGWVPMDNATKTGVSPGSVGKSPLLPLGLNEMLAGVDPEAEAKLVGLDQSIVSTKNSRYFKGDDEVTDNGTDITKIPVLLSRKDFATSYRTYTYESVQQPLVEDSINATVQQIETKGGQKYLDTLETTKPVQYKVTSQQVREKLVKEILDGTQSLHKVSQFYWMSLKPSPVKYQPVKSPFPSRWPFSYQIEPQKISDDSLFAKRAMYREAREFGTTSDDWKKLDLNYIGVFDPKKLNLSKDPLTELPMETYFPAKAQWVMDATDQPVNPPRDVRPTSDAYDFLTKPPAVLTTLDAAFKIRGKKAISAIRVNVKGVETMNATSEKKLKSVAKEIEDKTGLITDITLGSSPQYALTYLPGLSKESALGWVQQPWIKLGSSIAIFQEAKVGMSGIIASVIAVALVYVFSSNIILLYARKKEFAILLSLGWRPRQLSKLLFLEATILGTLVALIAWTILGSFWMTTNNPVAFVRILLIGLSGLLIYWGGTLVPMTLIKRIKPYESMRSGEVSKGRRFVRARSVLGMSINQLATYWQRTLLSVIAIALPTSLFIFFLFITFRLKGVLYATWLGEFVALEVGTMHYVAMGVALLIAILTTTEIMWQNVNERKSQLAVLKATGWRDGQVRLLVLSEGMMTGLLAGILGLLIALGLIGFVYNQFPMGELGFLSIMLLIPVITGILGALLPAQRAVRISPNAAIGSVVSNQKATERQFKIALGSIGTVLVVGVSALFFFAADEATTSTTKPSDAPNVVTTGTKLTDQQNRPTKQTETSKKNKDFIDELMDKGGIKTYPGDPEVEKREGFWVRSAKRINLPNVPESKQAVSVTLELQVKGEATADSYFNYAPSTFPLIDANNKNYTPEKTINHNKKAYVESLGYYAPYRSKIDVIYFVPKTEKTFVMNVNGAFTAHGYTVKITL